MTPKTEAAKSAFEEGMKALRWEWYKQRIEAVHQKVTAYDLLRQNGVPLKQVSDSRAEQIKCPFHGADNKPSARVYPDTTNRPSHVWCYVCQKSWDVIGLQMEFAGLKFSAAISDLERSYGIQTPPMPKELGERFEPPDEALEQFHLLYDACEQRLKGARAAYKALGELNSYLSASSLLDRVYFRVENRRVPPDRGAEVLQQLLAKINSKWVAGLAVLEQGTCPGE